MRIFRIALALAAIALIQPVFANEDMSGDNSKSCGAIAKACKDAGFVRKGDKKFWFDCMKPIMMGETVKGVTVDEATVKSCRADKITELKKMIKELEKASK